MADIDGPGHDDFFTPSTLAQHEVPLGALAPGFAAVLPSQHEAFDLPQCPSQAPAHWHAESWAGRVAMPRRNWSLILSTHRPQWALPGFTAFDAAIHCSSVNSTTGGGITPFSMAHTSRSCSEWQQQCVQHSVAEAHPQPHDSQGNRSPLNCPIHPVITRGAGSTPSVETRYTASRSSETPA